MKHVIFFILLVTIASAALATSITMQSSAVSTLIPNPSVYYFTNTNTRAAISNAGFTPTGGSFNSVSVYISCSPKATVTVAVTVYDSAGASLATGSVTSTTNKCNPTYNPTITLSTTVSVASAAKIAVAVS